MVRLFMVPWLAAGMTDHDAIASGRIQVRAAVTRCRRLRAISAAVQTAVGAAVGELTPEERRIMSIYPARAAAAEETVRVALERYRMVKSSIRNDQ